MGIQTDNFEDKVRLNKNEQENNNQYSKYRDLIHYRSSMDENIELAMIVNKPDEPSYILVETHGWHMSIPKYAANNDKPSKYLFISVDMRGRACSTGKPDCNGYELMDVYDAVEYVKKNYKEYIKDPNVIYFECGSGGGGNAFEIISKFPDYFAACTSMCGISDYLLWYNNDKVGEFRDEMDVWIGNPDSKTRYYSRSGLYGLENLITPLFIAHGTDDDRVPYYQSAIYKTRADQIGKGHLVKLLTLMGVGGFEHFENISLEQQKAMEDGSEENRLSHRQPVELPSKGRLIVKGFVVTKHFRFFLNSIDDVAYLDYDIPNNDYKLTYLKYEKGDWKTCD